MLIYHALHGFEYKKKALTNIFSYKKFLINMDFLYKRYYNNITNKIGGKSICLLKNKNYIMK